MNVAEFQRKWKRVELTERSAPQQHFLDLCTPLDHPMPAEHLEILRAVFFRPQPPAAADLL